MTQQEVATITFWSCDAEWPARAEGNAHLLAAAPELLWTVKQLLKLIPARSEKSSSARPRALNVIAEAEGKG